jgi:hypothetical protein
MLGAAQKREWMQVQPYELLSHLAGKVQASLMSPTEVGSYLPEEIIGTTGSRALTRIFARGASRQRAAGFEIRPTLAARLEARPFKAGL